jgi:hypothetical protein
MKACVLCVSALLGWGCGSSSSGGPVSAAWLGTFSADVTQVETCSGEQHTDTLTGSITIGTGSTGGTIVTQPSDDCDLTWTVNGTSAAIVSGTTCPTVPGSVGGTWTPTFNSGSLSLSGTTGRTSISINDSGTAVYVNGTTQTCTFTQSGTFTK